MNIFQSSYSRAPVQGPAYFRGHSLAIRSGIGLGHLIALLFNLPFSAVSENFPHIPAYFRIFPLTFFRTVTSTAADVRSFPSGKKANLRTNPDHSAPIRTNPDYEVFAEDSVLP